MRKFIILIITLGICGILSGEGWALPIQLGRHSANEIKRACGAAGGDFTQSSGGYRCSVICAGATGICEVACSNNGNCTGDCPACGGGDQPVLRGGRDAVTRVLNNFRTANDILQSDIEPKCSLLRTK
jgi:hypothetical protein